MALPEAPQGKQHPQTTAPQGGMLVTTPMGPQSQRSSASKVPLSDATLAEQKAGAEATLKASGRSEAEFEAGRKIVERLNAGRQPQQQPPIK